MGWASASEIVEKIIKTTKKHVPDEKTRVKMYKVIIRAFQDEDWDTEDECEGLDPAFDKALKAVSPSEDW